MFRVNRHKRQAGAGLAGYSRCRFSTGTYRETLA